MCACASGWKWSIPHICYCHFFTPWGLKIVHLKVRCSCFQVSASQLSIANLMILLCLCCVTCMGCCTNTHVQLFGLFCRGFKLAHLLVLHRRGYISGDEWVRMMREELIKETFKVLFPYNNNFANYVLIRGKQNVHRLIDNDGRWWQWWYSLKIPTHLGPVLLVVPVTMVQPLPAQKYTVVIIHCTYYTLYILNTVYIIHCIYYTGN